MRVDDPLGDVEPQARSDLTRWLGLPVTLEHMRQRVGGNARAVVDNGGRQLSAAAESGERLRPRHSFAVWKEEVRLHSHPWTASDLEAADELQRRAIEVDIERRLASEQRALQAREDLIAIVSHDLKSPLSAILLQAEVMSSRASAGDPAPLLHEGADRIRRSARHMKAMVDDLLDLAKLEAQGFALHLQPWTAAAWSRRRCASLRLWPRPSGSP